MTLFATLPVFLLAACSGDSDDKTADDSGNATGADRTFEDFVNVTTPWVGETAECIDGARGAAEPDPSCQVDVSYSGIVKDFQYGDGVAEAAVQLWADDNIQGGTPVATAADSAGNFTITGPACQPFAYGTSTPPEWQQTKDTYEVHQVYGYSESGSEDVEFNSVSEATSRLIPGLIGVEWDESTGIIAGTAYDCNENPIQYAQIFLHDANGNIPATGDIFYFSANGDTNLPTDKVSQPNTNTNGLWVAINVPAGTWTVEMWGWDGTQEVMLGATELQILAGSVNISNIYTGDDDGIYYPDSCLQACGG